MGWGGVGFLGRRQEIRHAERVWKRGEVPCLRRVQDRETEPSCKGAEKAQPRARGLLSWVKSSQDGI